MKSIYAIVEVFKTGYERGLRVEEPFDRYRLSIVHVLAKSMDKACDAWQQERRRHEDFDQVMEAFCSTNEGVTLIQCRGQVDSFLMEKDYRIWKKVALSKGDGPTDLAPFYPFWDAAKIKKYPPPPRAKQ